MKYLVVAKNPVTGERMAFKTNWFDAEKYNPDFDMVVVDLMHSLISFDGDTWTEIDEDYL